MPRAIELQDIKKIELDMLLYIHNICEERKINYFLCAGTLLGAVRHKGFIPWDDDIDIVLPRPDFDKLMSVLQQQEKYNLIDPVEDCNYYPFAKLCDKRTWLKERYYPPIQKMGVYIDIFPLDGFPVDYGQRKKHSDKLNKYWNRVVDCYRLPKDYRDKNELKRFGKIVRHYLLLFIFGQEKLKQSLKRQMLKYPYQESEYVGYAFTQYNERFVHLKRYYDKSILLEFEGFKFKAPSEYDKYLEELYGDYMKYPPMDQQVPHHDYEVGWIEQLRSTP